MSGRLFSLLKRLSLMEWLGYAGLLPFLGSFLASVSGFEAGLSVFLAYSALILSFMAGACWGVVQGRGYLLESGISDSSGADSIEHNAEDEKPAEKKSAEKPHSFSLLVTIATFLTGMFAWWYVEILGPAVSLMVLGGGFVCLFLLEQGGLYRHSYSPAYKRLRRHLSFTVIGLHLALLLVLLNGV